MAFLLLAVDWMLLLNSYYHNSYSFSTNTTSINSTHLHHSGVYGSPGHQVTTAPYEMIVCQNNYTETKIRAGFELHSMAYYKSIGGAGLSSLGWDLQSLGVLRADMSLGTYDVWFCFSFFPLIICSFILQFLSTTLILGNLKPTHDVNNVFITAMETRALPFFSSLESDFSTGYLEDALLEFNEPSKRRRLLLFSTDHDDQSEKSNHLPEVIYFTIWI